MEKRKTVKEYFEELKEVVVGTANEIELTEFLNGRIALLDKKTAKGNSKKEEENAEMLENVFNALLKLGKESTATEVGAALEVSNQKVSGYLKKLVAAERVARKEVKGTPYFSVVE